MHLAVPESTERMNRVRRRMDIAHPVRLLEHPCVATPFAFGLLRPTIVIPVGFESDFSPEQRDAVFAHELAHLGAADVIWQRISFFVVALVWWCPVAWYALRRLRVAMEMAADEASLCVPDGPRHLASCLVKLGRILAEQPRYALLGMAGNASRSGLAHRVKRLLEISDDGSKLPSRAKLLVRFGVLILFVCCSLLPGIAVHADQPIENGETKMQLLQQSWRRSVFAGIAAAVISPAAVEAQDVHEDVEVHLELSEDHRPSAERNVERSVEREIHVVRRNSDRDERPENKQKRQFRIKAKSRGTAAQAIRNAQRQIEQQLAELGREQGGNRVQRLQRELHAELRKLEMELTQHARETGEHRRDILVGRKVESQLSERKRQHLQVAIENLHAAGMHEHADRLEREVTFDRPNHSIDELTLELPEPRSARRSRSDSEIDRVRREMAEMRDQMAEMREMMHTLVGRNNPLHRNEETHAHASENDWHEDHDVDRDEEHDHDHEHDDEHDGHHDGDRDHDQ